jgi:hypothetical protein
MRLYRGRSCATTHRRSPTGTCLREDRATSRVARAACSVAPPVEAADGDAPSHNPLARPPLQVESVAWGTRGAAIDEKFGKEEFGPMDSGEL